MLSLHNVGSSDLRAPCRPGRSEHTALFLPPIVSGSRKALWPANFKTASSVSVTVIVLMHMVETPSRAVVWIAHRLPIKSLCRTSRVRGSASNKLAR